LFLDRDQTGQQAAGKVRQQLEYHKLAVTMFDWNQKISLNGQLAEPIPPSIQDPADMTVDQLRAQRLVAQLNEVLVPPRAEGEP